MTFKLEFEIGNDTFFGGDRGEEASCVLQEVAESVARGNESGTIHDSNGNRIGQYEMSEEAGA